MWGLQPNASKPQVVRGLGPPQPHQMSSILFGDTMVPNIE